MTAPLNLTRINVFDRNGRAMRFAVPEPLTAISAVEPTTDTLRTTDVLEIAWDTAFDIEQALFPLIGSCIWERHDLPIHWTRIGVDVKIVDSSTRLRAEHEMDMGVAGLVDQFWLAAALARKLAELIVASEWAIGRDMSDYR